MSDATLNNDGSVTLNSGQVIYNSHAPGTCLGEFCPLHNPSEHELRGAPLYFNGVHMYRKVGDDLRVDPDDYSFLQHGRAILRNSARCALCGDEIFSESRHDFRSCSCGEIFIDGGPSYLRRGAKDMGNFIDTSVVEAAA